MVLILAFTVLFSIFCVLISVLSRFSNSFYRYIHSCILMDEPPPNSYEAVREFLTVVMEQSCGGFSPRGPTDPNNLKNITSGR